MENENLIEMDLTDVIRILEKSTLQANEGKYIIKLILFLAKRIKCLEDNQNNSDILP
jgi:hypothetical protein